MHPAQTAKATRCRARKGACVTTQWHFWSTVAVALGLWCPVKCKVRNVNGWKKCIEPDGWQAPTASELQQRRLYFLPVLGVTNRTTAPHPVRENRGKEVNRVKESAGETFAPHACCLKWEVGSGKWVVVRQRRMRLEWESFCAHSYVLKTNLKWKITSAIFFVLTAGVWGGA